VYITLVSPSTLLPYRGSPAPREGPPLLGVDCATAAMKAAAGGGCPSAPRGGSNGDGSNCSEWLGHNGDDSTLLRAASRLRPRWGDRGGGAGSPSSHAGCRRACMEGGRGRCEGACRNCVPVALGVDTDAGVLVLRGCGREERGVKVVEVAVIAAEAAERASVATGAGAPSACNSCESDTPGDMADAAVKRRLIVAVSEAADLPCLHSTATHQR
jgi:hypothetical protein